MRLTGKVILIIVSTVTTIIALIFYFLALRFESQMEQNLLSTARSVYKNILIARKWVSDYNGVYVFKPEGSKSNPFLPNPEVISSRGDTLTLKNPALVTREFSELSQSMGGDFSFHMASRNYINPLNEPDAFEKNALVFFSEKSKSNISREFYRIESKGDKEYFRYFAPLFTEESCLSCHSKQGYKLGDLRGGISILLSADNYEQAKKSNYLFIMVAALVSILILSFLIFVAIQRSVIRPLKLIEKSARRVEAGDYSFTLSLPQKDEIGGLANTFESMRHRIQAYTTQLKTSEEKYRSLIEHSLEAVAIINSQRKIIDCNSKFSRLSGYKSDDLIHHKVDQLIDMQNKEFIQSPFSDGILSEHFETTLFSKDDLKIPVEIYVIHGFKLGDQNNLSFIYVRDLSERKKIEQYALQAEKMFALGQVSSGIAHEIRNPLFALHNNIDYLNKKFQDDKHFKEIYPELHDSIDRIHKIVAGVLDFAKPHKPEFKPYRIEGIIQKAIDLVKKQFEKSSITIETDYENSDKTVELDAHQIEQVFVNLFLNAFQAMEGTGKLFIKTRERASYREVQVIDTGKGIPAEEINRIFDPFYSKSSDGTGLGLAVVQRILEQHNAKYRVTSDPYFKTTFYIYLPYKQN